MACEFTYDELAERVKALEKENSKSNQQINELREKEAYHRMLVETMSDGYGIQDENGVVILVNNSLCEILGYTREEIIGKHVTDFFAEEQRSMWTELAPKRKKGQLEIYEIVMVKKNGQMVHTRISPSVIFDKNGNFKGSCAVITDISGFKKAEKKLKESESRYRKISELTSDFAYAFSVGSDGTLFFNWATDALLEITGYSSEELREKGGWDSIVYSEDLHIPLGQFKTLLRGQPKEVTYRIIDSSGRVRTLQDTAQPLWDKQNGRVTQIYGAIKDITKRREAQKSLQKAHDQLEQRVKNRTRKLKQNNLELQAEIAERSRAEEALRESEKKFRIIIEKLPMGVFMYRLEPDGCLRIIVSNPAAGRILGVDPAQYLGKTFEEAFPNAINSEFPERFRDIARNGGFWRKDNSAYKDEQIEGVFDSYFFQTSPGQMVAVFVDITERKRSEEALNNEFKIRSALSELYRPLISPTASIAEIADTVLQQAKGLTGSEHGYVSSFDSAAGDNVGHAFHKMVGEECSVVSPKRKIVFPKSGDGKYEGLWGHALNTQTPFYTNSPSTHKASTGIPEGHIGIERFLSVPVMLGQALVGEIALANKDCDYTDQDLEMIQRVAAFYALAIQRIRADEHIKVSLQEKEVLLQEIHHRVKNNMQVIRSLLSLQAANIQDEKLRACFSESRNRINAMAMIHEMLYQSNSISEFDLKTYIQGLASALSDIYGNSQSRIKIVVESEHIYLGLDQAIPCGLAINELLSNAFKYAFPQRHGEIRIEASITAKKNIDLIIRDNGVGLPANFDIHAVNTLGLKLVWGLVERQLGGKVEINREQGTRFSLQFPLQKSTDEQAI